LALATVSLMFAALVLRASRIAKSDHSNP
jgi:hypothetical protein